MKRKKTNFVKEGFIFLILLILIMLILAVALYDFVPSNISIPKITEYSSDSETTSIKQEIAYTNGGEVEDEEIQQELITSLKSYSIEASDLTVYGEKNLYNSGNSNPFDYAEETTTPTENTTTEQNTNEEVTNTASQANTTNTTSSTTTGTFFENTSSK